MNTNFHWTLNTDALDAMMYTHFGTETPLHTAGKTLIDHHSGRVLHGAHRPDRKLKDTHFTQPLYTLQDVGMLVKTLPHNGQRVLQVSIPHLQFETQLDAMQLSADMNRDLPGADTSVAVVMHYLQQRGLVPYPTESCHYRM